MTERTYRAPARLTGLAVAASLGVLAGGAAAQEFPAEPFTDIVPFSAGGTTDLNARTFETFWADQFGTEMKVE